MVLLTIIAIAVALIFQEMLVYALILFGAVILIFSIWQLFVKERENKIDDLQSQLNASQKRFNHLIQENEELRGEKLNVTGIKQVLDLGLMEVDTHFTRTANQEFERNEKKYQFIGALQVHIVAKYGVDIKALRIKYDEENNVLMIANIMPQFLSFKELNYTWKIAEVLEYRNPMVGSEHWRKSSETSELCLQLKEELRDKTHQRVSKGPKELDWIIDPLKDHILKALELLFGASGRTIKIIENHDRHFKSLDEFVESQQEEG